MEIIICRIGCKKTFKSIVTRQRHEKHYCKITKELNINNIESEKIKNEKYENEIKLLKQNLEEYIEIVKENEILKNKNTKLKLEIEKITLENKTITTDYLNLSKLIAENTCDMNMKLVQNTTDINMKLVQNSTDINVSALKFLTKRITDVPVLKQKNNEIVKSLENSKTNNLPLPKYIVMKYKKGEFANWIGEIIAKAYKGNTNDLQEIFTTDVSRLKCIIGQISDETKKASWVEDAGGIKVMELVIKPVLEMISKLILDAIQKYAIDDINNIDKMDRMEIDRMMEFQEYGTGLIDDITKNKLSFAILKIIANYLTFKRCNFDSDKKLLEDKKEELSESSEDEKPKNKKIIKKEVYDSSDYESSTDEDEKPKKIIKKKDSSSKLPSHNSKKPKNKKIIKKKVNDSSDYESSTDEDEKPKKIIKKKDSSSKLPSHNSKKIIKKEVNDSTDYESSTDKDEKSKNNKIKLADIKKNKSKK
jgi:hypothetical protein